MITSALADVSVRAAGRLRFKGNSTTALMVFSLCIAEPDAPFHTGLNAQLVNNRLSRRSESGGSLAIFNLDDPDIGIEALFAFEQFVDVGQIGGCGQLQRPAALAIVIIGGAGGRAEEMAVAIEVIDNNIDGASVLGAFADYRTEYSFDRAAAQEGTYPDRGLEAQWDYSLVSSDWPLILPSSATSSSEISPVSGSLRSC